MSVKYQYLISRPGDILFSIAVGTMAYFLYERDNPRSHGKSLLELLSRRRQSIVDRREHLRLERQRKHENELQEAAKAFNETTSR